jgi:hypothetical protein
MKIHAKMLTPIDLFLCFVVIFLFDITVRENSGGFRPLLLPCWTFMILS